MERRRQTRIERERQSIRRLRTARRTVSYILSKMIALIAIVSLCVLAFLTTERMANLYILVTEGMTLRAQCAIGEGDEQQLEYYFTANAIRNDEKLNSPVFSRYEFTGYNYDLSVEGISVWPWSTTATVTAVETMGLKGNIKAEFIDDEKTAADYPLPEWETCRLEILFVFNGTRWYIANIAIVERKPATAPLLTPDPNATVLPMATPTPSPDVVMLG
ncbi:MAG: hypothetical protein Q4C53_01120 [Clostridia bacterium]|nr:hypothetical protein [Clostridia bacterium]